MSINNKKIIIRAFTEAKHAIEDLINSDKKIEDIIIAADLIIQCLENNSTVFSCGNGGSMSDSMHFSSELSGRYRKDRLPLAAISISDPAYLTCAANDFGYEQVFSRFLEANGRKGDVLIAISTSGNSPNIINAVKFAKQSEIKVISLTGKTDSKLSLLSDVCICTPCGIYADRIQEMHEKILHILVELIERKLFPNNYVV